jgi:hypothetical protein
LSLLCRLEELVGNGLEAGKSMTAKNGTHRQTLVVTAAGIEVRIGQPRHPLVEPPEAEQEVVEDPVIGLLDLRQTHAPLSHS